MSIAPRPTALPVLAENIPTQLQARAQWVVWRYVWHAGKWTKPPHTAAGELASSTDSATWASFETALAAYRAGSFDGIGYVHRPEDNLIGGDADECRDPATGELSGADQSALLELDTYTEVSPSGTGLRAFAFGKKPGRKCVKGTFELYDGITAKGKPGGRFLTVTGHRLPDSPATINERQEAIERIYHRYWPNRIGSQTEPKLAHSNGKPERNGHCPLPLTDDERKRWRCIGDDKHAKIRALWGGDTSMHGGDDSRADLSLCAYLARLTNGNANRIEQLMGESALGKRDKWTDREDYRQRTIDFVLGDFEPWDPDPATRKPVEFRKETPPPATGDGETIATKQSPSAVIFQWLRDTLRPTFRRGVKVYSAARGREYSRTEVLPTSEIIGQLTAAGCAPPTKNGPDTDALPRVYREWLPISWGDLLARLDEEEDAAEIVEPAAGEFRNRIRAVFLTPISLAYRYQKDNETIDEVRRDPVVSWAVRFATGQRWGQVRGFQVWSCKRGGRILVAFRAALITQLHCRGWDNVDHRGLSRMCAMYDVGEPVKVKGGKERAIQLTPEFLEDLLDAPADLDDQTMGSLAREAEDCPTVRDPHEVPEIQGVDP